MTSLQFYFSLTFCLFGVNIGCVVAAVHHNNNNNNHRSNMKCLKWQTLCLCSISSCNCPIYIYVRCVPIYFSVAFFFLGGACSRRCESIIQFYVFFFPFLPVKKLNGTHLAWQLHFSGIASGGKQKTRLMLSYFGTINLTLS